MDNDNLPGSVNTAQVPNIHDDGFLEQIEMHLEEDALERANASANDNPNDKDGRRASKFDLHEDDKDEVITQTISILDEYNENKEKNDNNDNNDKKNENDTKTESENNDETQETIQKEDRSRKYTVESTNLDSIKALSSQELVIKNPNIGETGGRGATIEEEEEEVVTTTKNKLDQLDTPIGGNNNNNNNNNNNGDNENHLKIKYTPSTISDSGNDSDNDFKISYDRNGNKNDNNRDDVKDRKEDDEVDIDIKNRNGINDRFNDIDTDTYTQMLQEQRQAQWNDYYKQAGLDKHKEITFWDLCCGGCVCATRGNND